MRLKFLFTMSFGLSFLSSPLFAMGRQRPNALRNAPEASGPRGEITSREGFDFIGTPVEAVNYLPFGLPVVKAPAFRWTAVAGAKIYQVKIYDDTIQRRLPPKWPEVVEIIANVTPVEGQTEYVFHDLSQFIRRDGHDLRWSVTAIFDLTTLSDFSESEKIPFRFNFGISPKRAEIKAHFSFTDSRREGREIPALANSINARGRILTEEVPGYFKYLPGAAVGCSPSQDNQCSFVANIPRVYSARFINMLEFSDLNRTYQCRLKSPPRYFADYLVFQADRAQLFFDFDCNAAPWQNPVLVGDVNRDGRFTAADLLALARNRRYYGPLGIRKPTDLYFDVNGDGKFNASDELRLQRLFRNSLQTSP